MPSCAQVMAQTLFDLGVRRVFGVPGGEVLDFVEACRVTGMEFVLTRDEATAAFMADVTGQIQRQPSVCVSTLGPGALNLALGVANAYLERSPVIAVTASTAKSASPYVTHQNIDLNAVYRPFTKWTVTLDGVNTAATVRQAYAVAARQRMGPVHIALPSDVARTLDRETASPSDAWDDGRMGLLPGCGEVEPIAAAIREARRPVAILGFDLDPEGDREQALAFVQRLGAPVFVTPKAKGMIPEDHPLFFGVCAGVAADNLIVDFLARADLLIGLGFDPVESNKLWHQSMRLVSVSRHSIAAGAYQPALECVGDVTTLLPRLGAMDLGVCEWSVEELDGFRETLSAALRPSRIPRGGLSPYEVTRRLRQLFPRDAIHVTDVGSVKFVTSQVWQAYEPHTFLVANGLSSMSYALPGAMAAKLLFPNRAVLCTIGDGGLGMTLSDLETCVRLGVGFVIVVYNDSSLSLIKVAQEYRGYPNYGVDFGAVDFGAAARALGAWGVRIGAMSDLDSAVREGLRMHCPAVLDVLVDPSEYRSHAAPDRKR
ncbi:MAG: thiamine pyrophosphate-binding protein [Gemmatimonadota bacterium]|nr:MAG: thiamine pyrophosphate-binding protein [Gemmatimonadota bacterium]